jgi:DNA-binding HxlR family transcriptional regulator
MLAGPSIRKFRGCPIRATSAVMSGKWKVEIVWYLSFGTKRFAQLRGLLPGISEKMLAAQLKSLERDGIVSRQQLEHNPPRVDYTLTDSGRELVHVMYHLCNWGVKHLGVPPTMTGMSPMLTDYIKQLGTAKSR